MVTPVGSERRLYVALEHESLLYVQDGFKPSTVVHVRFRWNSQTQTRALERATSGTIFLRRGFTIELFSCFFYFGLE